MGSLVHFPGFAGALVERPETDIAVHSKLHSFFRSLPLERVGLNGEYDHSGLAKRVDRALHQLFLSQELEQLKITQRGRVVILRGYVLNASLLCKLVAVAAHTSVLLQLRRWALS